MNRPPLLGPTANQIERVRRGLQGTLPGLPAMIRMAPPFREDLIKRTLITAKPHMAAVLIPLILKEEQIHIIFTKRSAYIGVHSAQISFPGGRMEQDDEHLQATALRETQEELQLENPRIELLGALTPLYIPPSNYWVHPFAGILHNPPIQWNRQSEEVDRVLEPSLKRFLTPELESKKQPKPPREGRKSPASNSVNTSSGVPPL